MLLNKQLFGNWLSQRFSEGLCKEHSFSTVCNNCGKVPYHNRQKRKWRFDFAWPELGIAFEYEGIMSHKSRHTTVGGYAGDCEKYNEAQLLGWRVFRFTAQMLNDGKTIDLINSIMTNEMEARKDV